MFRKKLRLITLCLAGVFAFVGSANSQTTQKMGITWENGTWEKFQSFTTKNGYDAEDAARTVYGLSADRNGGRVRTMRSLVIENEHACLGENADPSGSGEAYYINGITGKIRLL